MWYGARKIQEKKCMCQGRAQLNGSQGLELCSEKCTQKPVIQSWVRYDERYIALELDGVVRKVSQPHTLAVMCFQKVWNDRQYAVYIKEYYIQHSQMHQVKKNSACCHCSKKTGQNYQNGIFGLSLQNKLSKLGLSNPSGFSGIPKSVIKNTGLYQTLYRRVRGNCLLLHKDPKKMYQWVEISPIIVAD